MTTSIRDATRPFTGDALTALMSPATRLLGLGEPTHGVEAFPELRNELFRHLVEHEGYRSITIESDCLAALAADAYVTDDIGTLDDAMSHGFSRGLGASLANPPRGPRRHRSQPLRRGPRPEADASRPGRPHLLLPRPGHHRPDRRHRLRQGNLSHSR